MDDGDNYFVRDRSGKCYVRPCIRACALLFVSDGGAFNCDDGGDSDDNCDDQAHDVVAHEVYGEEAVRVTPPARYSSIFNMAVLLSGPFSKMLVDG